MVSVNVSAVSREVTFLFESLPHKCIHTQICENIHIFYTYIQYLHIKIFSYMYTCEQRNVEGWERALARREQISTAAHWFNSRCPHLVRGPPVAFTLIHRTKSRANSTIYTSCTVARRASTDVQWHVRTNMHQCIYVHIHCTAKRTHSYVQMKSSVRRKQLNFIFFYPIFFTNDPALSFKLPRHANICILVTKVTSKYTYANVHFLTKIRAQLTLFQAENHSDWDLFCYIGDGCVDVSTNWIYV